MKSVQVNNQFYNNIHIGTKAERLALTHSPPYLYDRFIETDSGLSYLWNGVIWVAPPENSRYGGVSSFANSPMPVDTSLGGGAGLPFLKYLTADGSSNPAISNLNGDYRASPTYFYYEAPANSLFFAKTVTIQISDLTDMLQGIYGGIGVGLLTNGVKFFVKIGASYIRLLSSTDFKQNNDWYGLTQHIRITTFADNAQTLTIDFRIVDDFGSPLILSAGQQFAVQLGDDFRDLILHRFSLKGTQVTLV